MTYYIIGFDYEGEYAEYGLFTTQQKAEQFIIDKGLESAYVVPIQVND